MPGLSGFGEYGSGTSTNITTLMAEPIGGGSI